MEARAIQIGARYFDMANPGRVAHVVRGGMASGRDFFVVSEGGFAVTSFARTFNPGTLLPTGAPRWVPFP
jgi:hypothetical protein